MTPSHRLRLLLAALAMSTVFATAACAFDPGNIPMPGSPAADGGYRLHAEFTSVLNLPQRAPVKSGGHTVGSVAAVQLRGELAVADLDIDDGVTFPVGTRAELRQDTLLGDLYVALEPPVGDRTRVLSTGDTISVRDTSTSNIEDLLRGVATMINGGAIGALSRGIAEIDAALPDDPEQSRDIAVRQARILHDANANSVAFDSILHDVEAAAGAVAADLGTVTGLLDQWPARQSTVNDLAPQVARYFQTIPRAAAPLANLLTDTRARDYNAIIDMLAPLLRTLVTIDITAPQVLGPLDALVRTKLAPLAAGAGGVDLRLTGGDPLAPDVLSVLQALGMVSR